MRDSLSAITTEFESIRPPLEAMKDGILDYLCGCLKDLPHIDNVCGRVKTLGSFSDKASKVDEQGKWKYEVPIKEIQDLIGLRVVVYYLKDVDPVGGFLEKHFNRIEKRDIIPDDASEFGYEGRHYVFLIPRDIYTAFRGNPLMPDFFELQVKTLYQHAWAQGEHGLGYKPGRDLSRETRRKLAFVAAQSWGADQILNELYVPGTRNN